MARVVLFCVVSLALASGVLYWVVRDKPVPTAKFHPTKVHATPGETPPAADEDGIAVYFSPEGGCTEAIVREIAAAKKTVHMQAATFTSPQIARALIAARQRGVDVRLILDRKKDDDRSQSERLVDAGVPTFIDGKHHTAHNKVVVIDGQVLITGSFNFTKESEQENAENLLVVRNKPQLVDAYERNFAHHLSHSQSYTK